MLRGRKTASCPAEITLRILSGRWKLLILHQLVSGVNRFGELHRALSGVSKKILAQHLRELERDGVIDRKVYAEVPPKVEYSLTASGKALTPIIDAMHDWGLDFKGAKD
jgi:DNA-binding HxlR family transcriptional regulator